MRKGFINDRNPFVCIFSEIKYPECRLEPYPLTYYTISYFLCKMYCEEAKLKVASLEDTILEPL